MLNKVMSKKEIRDAFRNSVFKRDNYTCKVCGTKSTPLSATVVFDSHHITDRTEIVNGGYVMENGITVCKKDCHFLVELFHINNGDSWSDGLHPDDLYKLINSSKELAIEKSNKHR
jgi:predicted restriction endonuclease